MSRLQELIRSLCPDGVVYKPLGEVCSITIGEFVKKDKQTENGKYPVYNGGRENTGFYEDYNNVGNKVIISARGVNAGFVNRVYTNYWAGNSCYSLSPLNTKRLYWIFLYYVLKAREKEFMNSQQRGSIPALSKKQIEQIQIPLPPLEVQAEIVRILDAFTSYAAELQAELQARKEQYTYYRNRLFDLKTVVGMYKLSDICTAIGDGLHGTPKYEENGDYFFINGNNLVSGRIALNSQTKRIGCEEFCKYDCKFNYNTVFLSINGTIGNVALYNNEQIVLGKSVAYFFVNQSLLNVKFLYYYFQSKYARNYFESNLTGSTIKNLGLKALRNMIIPIPSLSEQQRIVSILDRFEALVNDLTEGLPAEIAAVQEQYEYYRNQLLSFPRKEDENA